MTPWADTGAEGSRQMLVLGHEAKDGRCRLGVQQTGGHGEKETGGKWLVA